MSKTVNGQTTEYVWDGDYIVMEKTGESVTVYKRGTRLFAGEKDGAKTYYRYNARGDVVQITDGTYTVTKNYQYDAFGNEQNPDANDANPFRYCGEYFDTETGYIYLRARYYDPAIGRFISEDPIRDGLNWYVYCENNPVMFIDPSGYWAEGDEKFSTTVQTELLKLTLAWYLAESPEDKAAISSRANEVRNIASTGGGKILDTLKTVTGALADEFSWFLGGDVDRAERDYWLTQVQQYQPVQVSEKTTLNSIIFVASIVTPSPDDAMRMISQKASKEMMETVGEKGVKKFLKSTTKYAGKQGTNGIKKLQGKGIKGYMYEVKVKGAGGTYRLLGNKTKDGDIFWEIFEKTHH